ncbi:tRNA dihydrouridine synthase DusB [Anaerocolumna aminovalerica]|jgi:tRNA-dihydrouridine synthase B|uniref:tRNA-dihydrouridine synthase n=1 Tax=Anaerocolumna aminovalerica TaxID=1527 RepID=A0A1I5H0B8_9FIRM|nr:tRNA dihydrouridine synthase DusB [Anaerocolumna aminovalerica]MDU6265924.1 tRNA dihydrouridine synthase DusB [Anaerocolumna aminovalerica]SFO41748.1 putative TIM-barrel protein, nifR3 family [Anaerocolumna aminovalerica]
MSLMIGNIKIDGNLVLGPMAGVTDLPFRLLCKEQGADLIYTEMVSAKGIQYNNKNTEKLLEVAEGERPVSLQLFGSDPYIMSETAKRIEDKNFDILDINMGCPVPKVVNNGEGSGLMKNPKLVGEIVHAVSSAIKKPLTVKIRKGFTESTTNAVEIAKIAEANGAAAVAVHGRTREQYYSGEADWKIIKAVKEAVSIPVIGNGDVITPESATALINETGCDAVMIARGARGNPWIFSQIKEYYQTGKIPKKPTPQEAVDMMLRHARMSIDYKGEYTGIREMRKHIAWYTTGYPLAAKLRNRVNEIESIEQLQELLFEYLKSIG